MGPSARETWPRLLESAATTAERAGTGNFSGRDQAPSSALSPPPETRRRKRRTTKPRKPWLFSLSLRHRRQGRLRGGGCSRSRTRLYPEFPDNPENTGNFARLIPDFNFFAVILAARSMICIDSLSNETGNQNRTSGICSSVTRSPRAQAIDVQSATRTPKSWSGLAAGAPLPQRESCRVLLYLQNQLHEQ